MIGEDREMSPEEKKEIAALEARVAALEKTAGRRYDSVADCPEWLKPTVKKLVGGGLLRGDGKGKLGLSDDAGRVLVIVDRAGGFPPETGGE